MRTSDARDYMNRRYRMQRDYFTELLGGRCKRCKADTELEFDHIDPAKKTMSLSGLFTKPTIVAAVTELVTKCQLLCKTCHREKSRAEQQVERGFRHGSFYGWLNKKCQCHVCLTAKWAFHDKRNAGRRTHRGPYQTRRMLAAEIAGAVDV